jgi:alpha-tubulin suppressor-like RCC1 family protein
VTRGVLRVGAGLVALGCHSGELLELPAAPASAGSTGGNVAPGVLEPLRDSPVQALGLGVGFTCALLTGGALKCWGSDQYGVLGVDPVLENISDPSRIGPIDFGTARRVVQLSVGWHHVCVLFEDARARCWGHNDSGQLGRGTTDDYGDDEGETLAALADLPLERVIGISAGVSNTCVLLRSGEGMSGSVHCFGSDVDGGVGDESGEDFGDDEPISALRPVNLPEPVSQVAAGDMLGCARLLSGPVQCWGSNKFGTLGIGATPCNIADERVCAGMQGLRTNLPVLGLSGRFVTSVQVNQAHACALDNQGELLCWGRNDESRAGYPQAIHGLVLPQTPGPLSLGAGVHVVSPALGMRHGCALDTVGSIRCWGEAGPQLGYGMAQQDGVAGIGGTEQPSAQYEQMPYQGVVQLGDTDDVPGNDLALRLYSGGRHNCAILSGGRVRCWGSNASGELGYGDFSQIGDIGDEGSPATEYERLNHYDVCVVPSFTSACSN